MDVSQPGLGDRLRALRSGAGLSLRDLGERAGVAPSYLSNLERGGSSPTLTVLHNVLMALGTDLQSFLEDSGEDGAAGRVFRREHMRTAADASRRYTFLLPRRPGIGLEILDEYLLPGESPPFEHSESEVAGTVLGGVLELEIDGEPPTCLRPGDAFHVPPGVRHRGRCASSEPVRLLTVFTPPKY